MSYSAVATRCTTSSSKDLGHSIVAELPDIKTIKANINAAAKSLQMVDGGSLAAAKRAVLADLDPKQRELLDGTSTGKRCGQDC
jgi:hypothetical protein